MPTDKGLKLAREIAKTYYVHILTPGYAEAAATLIDAALADATNIAYAAGYKDLDSDIARNLAQATRVIAELVGAIDKYNKAQAQYRGAVIGLPKSDKERAAKVKYLKEIMDNTEIGILACPALSAARAYLKVAV